MKQLKKTKNNKMNLFKKISKEGWLLLFIFIFVLAFRLYFVFQSKNFSSDEAYFHLRHINYILENNKILFYDDLSYGGRYVLYPPLFHILFAYITLGSMLLLKIFPAVFASLLVFAVYFIAKYITNDKKTALFTSLLVSFVPLYITETLNNLSPYSLVIPLIFFMLYCLSKIDNQLYLWMFILSSLLLPFLHATAILFLLTILIYLIISKSEGLELTKLKKEAMLFSVAVIILIELIIFKKAFLQYGLDIIWQNTPVNIFADEFKSLNVFGIIFGVGIVQLIFGLFGLYYGLHKLKKRLVYMTSSLILGIFVLLLLRLIPLSVGLMFLGISLAITSSLTIKFIFEYFEQTKLFNYEKYFTYMFLFLVLFLSIIPIYSIANKVSPVFDQTIADMEWINNNVREDATVLAPLQEGNLIISLAKRKNVADSEFLLAPNALKRSEDIKIMYTVGSEAIALGLMHKYNINVIYESDNLDKIYGKYNLAYLNNKECFNEIMWRIYEVRC